MKRDNAQLLEDRRRNRRHSRSGSGHEQHGTQQPLHIPGAWRADPPPVRPHPRRQDSWERLRLEGPQWEAQPPRTAQEGGRRGQRDFDVLEVRVPRRPEATNVFNVDTINGIRP